MDGPNDEGRKFKQVHKVDRPHKGSRLQSTIWTDPMTKIIKQVHKVDGPNKGSILKSTTWTDPTKVQYLSPQLGQTQQRAILKSTTWTDFTNGLNRQDKMSTKQIQLNLVHNGQNQIVLKILEQNK